MARRRNRAVDWLVYAAVRVVVAVVQMLSLRSAYKLAAGLAWLAYHVDRRHREVARDNLRHAFPERFRDAPDAEEACDRTVRAVYRHFCTLLIEIIQTPRRLTLANWRDYAILPDGGALLRVLLSGRPVLIATGHFGNWELAGYILNLLGFTTHAIARPLDNPYLDAYLRRFREHTGQKILAKKGDFDRMTEVLASGGILATLADQDAGQRGLFVDFFNRPASTHKAIALMAMEYEVLIMVTGVVRVGEPMRYQVVLEDVIDPRDYANQPDPVRAITQRYMSALERIIRAYPEQYFWLHRRWKHQPKVKLPSAGQPPAPSKAA